MAASLKARADEEKVLNIYNWSNYILPSTLEQFEKETGIKVEYDVYDSNQMLESKLMAGSTGYDIVVPTAAPFLERQIKLGLYQKLKKDQLPNYKNLDPKIIDLLAKNDHQKEYSVPWMWGSVGIGYNIKKVKEIMPDAPLDSLKMIFDPAIAQKFSKCGITIIDSPSDVIPNALVYLGLDPNSEKKEDLEKAEKVLMAIRPYIRNFHSSKYIDDLANGEICLALGFSGDIIQAGNRATEAKNGIMVKYTIPKEGAQVWIDVMAITKDAKHPTNAHKFIDFILRPGVAAANTNYIGYANGNEESKRYVSKRIIQDKEIYPSNSMIKKMYSLKLMPASFERLRTRMWTKILSAE
jgi:putrescine transport system substrate-binding protein